MPPATGTPVIERPDSPDEAASEAGLRVDVVSPSGSPVQGARVRLVFLASGGADTASRTTDANGSATFPVQGAPRSFTVQVAATGMATYERTHPLGVDAAIPRTLRVPMRPGASVRVRVVDDAMMPRPGFTVQLIRAGPRKPDSGIQSHTCAMTARDGVAGFQGLEPGDWEMSTVEWKDCMQSTWQKVRAAVDRETVVDLTVQRWNSHAYMSGRIILDGLDHEAGVVENYGIEIDGVNSFVPIHDDHTFYCRSPDGDQMRIRVVGVNRGAGRTSAWWSVCHGQHGAEFRPTLQTLDK